MRLPTVTTDVPMGHVIRDHEQEIGLGGRNNRFYHSTKTEQHNREHSDQMLIHAERIAMRVSRVD